MSALRPSLLWETWLATAERDPGKIVLRDAESDLSLSAAALTARAEAEAERLREVVSPGTVVAFAQPNALWLPTFLALQHLGAAALALDPSTPETAQPELAAQLGAARLIRGDEQVRLESSGAAGWPAETCLFKLTSGSTGRPRALPFPAAALLADGRQVAATMSLRPDDTHLALLPFGHSYALGNLVLPLLQQGAALVLLSQPWPEAVAGAVETHAATVLPAVPALLRALVESDLAPRRLGSLRMVISAGAPLAPEVARAFAEKFGRAVHNFYGSSETGGICFDRTGRSAEEGRGVGKPMEGTRVLLDEEGRVRVLSEAGCPALREADGAITLGDHGQWNDRGELTLLGRAVGPANIGGKKVFPGEVEAALRSHPAVSDAWVGVGRRGSGEEFLLAAVETQLGEAELRAWLAGRLPAWKLPRRLRAMPALPRTTRGKLDPAEIRARLGAESE